MVVPIHALSKPPKRFETFHWIVTQRQIGRAIDGDPVVVVDDHQIGQTKVPRETRRLLRHPFHQVAIGRQNVDSIVDQGVLRRVDSGSHHLGRKREPHAVAHSLP